MRSIVRNLDPAPRKMPGRVIDKVSETEYLYFMRLKHRFSAIVLSGLLLQSISYPASQADTQAPKGVSTSLWSAFTETAILDLEGQKRNFRWTTSPAYFVKGSPSQRDTDTLNNILFYVSSGCNNIKPGKSSTEPSEGVIFNFVKPTEFSKIIPGIPKDVTTSYILWNYYKDRGITKANIVISTEETDLTYRDYLIRLRVLQGLGFYSLTEKAGYKLFSRSYNWENSNGLSNADKELLSFYCSTLIRAWDTETQTQTFINEEYNKNRSAAPNFDNSVTVDGNSSQPKFTLQPYGDLIILNGVKTISYRVLDSSESAVDGGDIDVSADAFGIRVIEMKNLASRKSYSLLLYPKNASGFGFPQRINFRTSEVGSSPTASTPSSPAKDASEEVIDSFNAASDSYNLAIAAKKQCTDTLRGTNLANRRIYGIVSKAGICVSEDVGLENAKVTLNRLKSSLGSSSLGTTAINQLNSLTDELNLIAEAMDAATVYLEEIGDVGQWIIDLEREMSDLRQLLEKYDNVINRLPATIQKSLKRESSLLIVEDYRVALDEVQSGFETLMEELGAVTSFDLPEVEDLSAEFDEFISNLPDQNDLSQSISTALKKLPAFYCKKGKVTTLPNKGKCLTGYSKVSIIKN